jgi:hypothetical protein
MNPRKAFEQALSRSASKADLDKLREAVEAASSFMNVGSELKKLGIKYDFSTEMMPIYMVTMSGTRYAIINKKHADDPDFVVGNIAVGKL